MKLRYQFINLSVLIAVVIMSLSACKSEKEVSNEEKFARLNPQERAQAYADTKQDIVNRLICSRFSSEINEYTSDIKKKELKMNWLYFNKYPYQFEVTKLFHKGTVAELLKRNAVYDYDASMNDMKAPLIETLPCQETIANWTMLQQEYSQIKVVMPSEYFYEESWSYKLEKAKRWIEELFSDIFNVLLYIAAFALAFYLHYELVVKKNLGGLWFIVITPFLTMPLLTKFKQILPSDIGKLQTLIIATLSISVLFTIILLLFSNLLKSKQDDIDG